MAKGTVKSAFTEAMKGTEKKSWPSKSATVRRALPEQTQESGKRSKKKVRSALSAREKSSGR